MEPLMIDCRGVSKTFVQSTIPVVRLQDVILGIYKRPELMHVEAVQDCTLQVKKGEWVAICGPNGSGKTTLMKIVAGLMTPNKGTVELSGSVSTFFDLGIGFHPERPARENIRLHGLLHGLTPKEIETMTESILDFADIGPFSELPLKCYSSGMRLRLAFAAAAHVDTDIYLFDEILAVGDRGFQKKCLKYIVELKKAGKTAVIVGNNFTGLSLFADRVIMLEHGRMTEEHKPSRDRDEDLLDALMGRQTHVLVSE